MVTELLGTVQREIEKQRSSQHPWLARVSAKARRHGARTA
jgi:hypothetical protein